MCGRLLLCEASGDALLTGGGLADRLGQGVEVDVGIRRVAEAVDDGDQGVQGGRAFVVTLAERDSPDAIVQAAVFAVKLPQPVYLWRRGTLLCTSVLSSKYSATYQERRECTGSSVCFAPERIGGVV